MKIKKQIEVEIEIKSFDRKRCSSCIYIEKFVDSDPFCGLFRIKINKSNRKGTIFYARCQQCIDTFGMGE